jgi:hypothetical protein
MLAQFDTECPICDGSIRPGDQIKRDEKGRWIHAVLEECGPYDALKLPADVGGPVCRRCNIVTPCWCDEPDVEDAADQALRRAKENATRDPWEGF